MNAEESGIFPPFEYYRQAFQENLNGPLPICVGKSEEACRIFFHGLDARGHFTPMKLLTFGYSGIKSSTALCLAGATSSIPSVLRSSAEAIAYALLFERNPEWAKIWNERHSSKNSKNKFRHGSTSALKLQLQEEDPKLHDRYTTLYEQLIDFGAHPNLLGVEATINYEPLDDGDVFVSFHQLSGPLERKFAFIDITLTTILMLDILSAIWPEISLRLRIDELRQEVVDHMHQYSPTADELKSKF